MLPRHSNELLGRLERVADLGCVEIRKPELLLWYGQERVTIGIWRDIQEKWEEVLDQGGDEPSTPLLVGEAEGVWAFIWGEGLTTSESSWFKDVRSLSKRNGKLDDAA